MKRLLPLLVVLVLGISTPLIAQYVEQPEQQPVVESPAVPAQSEDLATNEAASDQSSESEETRELPRTASPLPLLALLGLSSGGAAFSLHRRR